MNAFKTENIEKAFCLDSIHKIIDTKKSKYQNHL